jgi:predicted nucleic acid-binding protein
MSVAHELHVAEPPAAFGRRPPAVVDASVVCAIVFAQPELDHALARVRRHALVAPELLPFEVAKVAVMKRRRGAPLDDVRAAVQRFLTLDIVLERADPEGCLDLALRYQLTACDAAYLWLAAELKYPLATFDARLAEAARQHLGTLE